MDDLSYIEFCTKGIGDENHNGAISDITFSTMHDIIYASCFIDLMSPEVHKLKHERCTLRSLFVDYTSKSFYHNSKAPYDWENDLVLVDSGTSPEDYVVKQHMENRILVRIKNKEVAVKFKLKYGGNIIQESCA